MIFFKPFKGSRIGPCTSNPCQFLQLIGILCHCPYVRLQIVLFLYINDIVFSGDIFQFFSPTAAIFTSMKRRDNAKSHFRKAFPAALGAGAPRYLHGSSNGIRSGCKTLSGGPTRSVNGMQGEKRSCLDLSLLCHKSPIYAQWSKVACSSPLLQKYSSWNFKKRHKFLA